MTNSASEQSSVLADKNTYSTKWHSPLDIQEEIDQLRDKQVMNGSPINFVFWTVAVLCSGLNQGVSALTNFGPVVAAARKLPPEQEISAEIPVSPSGASYQTMQGAFNHELIANGCHDSDTLTSCVTNICGLVSSRLMPLNKPEPGKELSLDDLIKLTDTMGETQKKTDNAMDALIIRANKIGIRKELLSYLVIREYWLHNSPVANCGGGAAKAALMLSNQPKIKHSNVLIETHSVTLNTELGMSHVYVRVHQPDKKKTLICDPWMPEVADRRAGIAKTCNDKQVKKGKPARCAWYQPEKLTHMESTEIKPLKRNKLSAKELQFLDKEVERQNTEFEALNSNTEVKSKLSSRQNRLM